MDIPEQLEYYYYVIYGTIGLLKKLNLNKVFCDYPFHLFLYSLLTYYLLVLRILL